MWKIAPVWSNHVYTVQPGVASQPTKHSISVRVWVRKSSRLSPEVTQANSELQVQDAGPLTQVGHENSSNVLLKIIHKLGVRGDVKLNQVKLEQDDVDMQKF